MGRGGAFAVVVVAGVEALRGVVRPVPVPFAVLVLVGGGGRRGGGRRLVVVLVVIGRMQRAAPVGCSCCSRPRGRGELATARLITALAAAIRAHAAAAADAGAERGVGRVVLGRERLVPVLPAAGAWPAVGERGRGQELPSEGEQEPRGDVIHPLHVPVLVGCVVEGRDHQQEEQGEQG